MRWSLGTSHSPAWTRLLLTGTLLTFSTCSASLELPFSVSLDPLTEGADAHLPVPRSLDGVLSTSWFRGHEVRPEAMIFSAEGLPGPGHTGRETLDTQGSLIIRNVTTLDAGSYTVVMETSAGRRSATEQIQVKATYDGVQLVTFPGNKQGVLRSELNYSVILQWAALITPEPVLRWTFNGRPRGTGERLIVHRLSMKDLGTYLCLAENSQGVYLSQPVTIMLPQADVEPTEPAPISRNPPLSLSGGSAIALVVAASVVGLVLVGSVLLTVIQKLSPRRCSPRLRRLSEAGIPAQKVRNQHEPRPRGWQSERTPGSSGGGRARPAQRRREEAGMASTFLFTLRLLLLQFLLPLFWAPLGADEKMEAQRSETTGTKATVWTKIITVQAPPQLSHFLGETVILSCKLYPLEHNVTVTQVTWTKQRQAELARSVAVFHPAQGPSFHESSRLEFIAAKPGEKLWDASLVVRELRVEDEANYTCQFATFPNGDKSARILLRVLAKPQNKAETLDISLSPNPVPVARCISKGGHPPARISWSSDGKTNTTQVPGPLPGTITVISLLILTPSSQMDGRNVTCRVEHESFKEPEVLPMTLAVSAPPEVSISGYDDNWYIGRRGVALNCDVRSKPEPTGYSWSTTNGTLPPSVVAQGTQLLIHTVDKTINATFICLVTNALGTSQANVTVLLRGQNQYSPSTNGMVRYSAVGSNQSPDPPTEGTR
ncbi:uncharacterized protein ACBT57_009318 isoform 4-T4 [Dama dama]